MGTGLQRAIIPEKLQSAARALGTAESMTHTAFGSEHVPINLTVFTYGIIRSTGNSKKNFLEYL
jgi:hypothetical protein